MQIQSAPCWGGTGPGPLRRGLGTCPTAQRCPTRAIGKRLLGGCTRFHSSNLSPFYPVRLRLQDGVGGAWSNRSRLPPLLRVGGESLGPLSLQLTARGPLESLRGVWLQMSQFWLALPFLWGSALGCGEQVWRMQIQVAPCWGWLYFLTSIVCPALLVGNSLLAAMISSWTICHCYNFPTPKVKQDLSALGNHGNSKSLCLLSGIEILFVLVSSSSLVPSICMSSWSSSEVVWYSRKLGEFRNLEWQGLGLNQALLLPSCVWS